MSYPIEFINSIECKALENTPKYQVFIDYISKYGTKKQIVHQQQQLPLYLQNRYGAMCLARSTNKTNRKKLYVDSGTIKEEVHDILSKLSEGNKVKLFDKFFGLSFDNDNLDIIALLIYEYSIDLTYMNNIYGELIYKISLLKPELFGEIINLILTKIFKPDQFVDKDKEKRWMQSNAILVGKLIEIFKDEIPFNTKNLIDSLKILSFHEAILLILKNSGNASIIKTEELYIESVGYNKSFDAKLKFMALDLLELI